MNIIHMKKVYTVLAAFLHISLTIAQLPNNRTFTNLDIGEVDARIYSDGNLFQDIVNNAPAFEVPKGSNSFSIYASTFWMTALGQKNGYDNISYAYDKFGQENLFATGPIDIVNQTKSLDPQFQRLWKVNRFTVNNHIQNWNSLNYTVPAEIADWPGNGNANTAQQLAPFKDLDNDGIYEPQNGEYPEILGDQAVYLIANTQNVVTNDSTPQGPDSVIYSGLYIEFHAMLYAFQSNVPAISNTVFANVKLYNRSLSSIGDHQDFKFSVFTDFDLGNWDDDYIGTDTAKNMYYAYNGDGFDEAFGGRAGYGTNYPAQGVKFLDSKLDHTVYFMNGSAGNGFPFFPSHHAGFQRGKWKNGGSMFYGGDGLSYCVDTNQRVRHMYTGNPNTVPNQWTEKTPCATNAMSNPPGERRMAGGPNLPSQFNHGTSITFNYAYIFAQQSGVFSAPVAKLSLVADTVQNFFNSTIVGINEVEKQDFLAFELFPNPARDEIKLKLSEEKFEVSVFKLNGSLIKRIRNQKTIDISDLDAGMYFIRIENNNVIGIKKLIVVE